MHPFMNLAGEIQLQANYTACAHLLECILPCQQRSSSRKNTIVKVVNGNLTYGHKDDINPAGIKAISLPSASSFRHNLAFKHQCVSSDAQLNWGGFDATLTCTSA